MRPGRMPARISRFPTPRWSRRSRPCAPRSPSGRRGRARFAPGSSAACSPPCSPPASSGFPDALIRHTARVVPQQTRAAIGEDLLAHVVRLTGPPCAESTTNRSLMRLDRRLRGTRPWPPHPGPRRCGGRAAPAGRHHPAAPHAGGGSRASGGGGRSHRGRGGGARRARDPLLDLLAEAGLSWRSAS